jgi:hypothetical protein
MIKIVKELQTKLDFTSLDSLSESDFLDSPFEADDEQIQQIIQSLIENASKRSDTDLMASKEIYNWLQSFNVTSRMESDRKFWQSLALFVFRDYVSWRWDTNLDDAGSFTPSQIRRYLGSGQIGGYSHNTISRLYFPAKILLNEKDGEELLESFWDNQQKEQSFMQNETAMIDKVIVALVKTTKGVGRDGIINRAKKITAIKNSRAFSYLSEEKIIEILTF